MNSTLGSKARRALFWGFLGEIPLAVFLAIVGLPTIGSSSTLAKTAELVHSPGFIPLGMAFNRFGPCCGFTQSWIDAPGGPPIYHLSIQGLLTLAVTNAMVLALVLFLCLVARSYLVRYTHGESPKAAA